MSHPAIELVEVTKRFGDFVAVDRLSLRVEAGEIVGLLGPNGSGKTTTVNMLSGLSRATAGVVRVIGHDMAGNPRSVRALLGVVPQETALYEELSAEANLRFHADLFDVPRRAVERRVTEVLDLVELADRRRSRVGTFSGGMKRRLALARALVHEPQLLYLDEPTLGVDIQSRRAIWDHVLGLKRTGKTVLITTNYLEEANALCDRLVILDHGRLVAEDTPRGLRHRFGDTVINMVVEPEPAPALLERLRALAGVSGVSQSDGTLTVTVEGDRNVSGAVVGLVAREGELQEISQHETSLDEVFLSLTGRQMRD
jgi:daunorubicin resistance ABC transporter ATP-binding subunit